MKMKLVLRARDIPEHATVTKKTGEKEYTLRDRINIYKTPEDGSVPSVLMGDGTRFIIDDRGNIECVPHDKELMWHTDEDSLYRWLQEREMERESK